ncbi:hypothetical protein [Microbacterium invictum]|uniref:Uncharacterized protein n=1 Tax=Microbacterium invictum TaxID=515415 RepID=A0ABZ0V8Z8_9MICO|nr:hypothetical protein [Microbacterium invictum]WQB70108.1 hypothetical protein T9R20_15625 [Microbacterium invictum]
MIPVWASPGVARPVSVQMTAAMSSLAGRVVAARAAAGALTVVGGDGWCGDAHAALDAGARGIFALHPRGVGASDLEALRSAAGTRPVFVERHRSPRSFVARVAELLAAPPLSATLPSLIDVAVSAPRNDLVDALADAVGWAATLSGTADLRPMRQTVTDHGAIGLLSASSADGAPGVAVTVSATVLAAGVGTGVLRATSLAPARLEVEIDLDAGTRTATVVDELGAVAAAPSFEDPVRAALRHALDRLDAGQGADDLDALRRDRACADALLARATSS